MTADECKLTFEITVEKVSFRVGFSLQAFCYSST